MPSPSDFSKEFDWITLPESPERWCSLVWTFSAPTDSVARCTVAREQFLAVLEFLRRRDVPGRNDSDHSRRHTSRNAG